MNDVTSNGSLPSAADGLGGESADTSSGRSESPISAEALHARIEELSERVGQIYTRSNMQVTRAVDPIPSLLVTGLAGFAAGYLCRASRDWNGFA